jgi:hypothetical protein
VRTLDAGGYTIYAVSQPKNKDDLSDAKYATAAIQLKTGFLTATSSGAKIAKGDDLKITGTAMGDPDNVFVWIFGKNRQVLGESATVESDGSFRVRTQGRRHQGLVCRPVLCCCPAPDDGQEAGDLSWCKRY